jgi:bifunctional UDP-N-acetylglucosamine pyrophosphorylase/glucosamine-1-phosphate N-acetyltransferase
MTKKCAGIVLAAGKGTRMKSRLPKVLHTVCGLPMVEYAVRALRDAGIERPIVVIGHEGHLVQQELGDSCDYVWQHEQKGTGHAALQAQELLKDYHGPVVITAGDTPLLEGDVIRRLLERCFEFRAHVMVAAFTLEDPSGYGRIVRDKLGGLLRIVEHRDAYEEVLGIKEVNAGVYCFDCRTLFDLLPTLGTDNKQGEFYLTDMVSRIVRHQGVAEVECFDNSSDFFGVNDRWELAQAERVLRTRILRRLAMDGVTIRDPNSVMVGPDVRIGKETVIEAFTSLVGRTEIGADCRIGPNALIENSTIGDGCLVYMSRLQGAMLGNRIKVGPFANLRPGAELADEVKVGNFVEIKKARLAEEVAASHLSYIGDAEIGPRTNIGAGTITCNYDGLRKHRTVVGADAFIGSDTTLVAPVTVGEGAIIAAGSTITEDVPDNAMAIARQRQEVKPEWASQWRKKQK